MSKDKTVYIGPGEWIGSAIEMFSRRGYVVLEREVWEPMADFICFMGGVDVNPKLYGEANVASSCDDRKDAEDIRLYELFKNKPKVGICRGGQFLNVMSGGKMWQHVDNHGGNHWIDDIETGKTYIVSSTHHQMMRPSMQAEIIGVAYQSLVKVRDKVTPNTFIEQRAFYNVNRGTYKVIDNGVSDIEILYYEHTNSLCFQPHPEIGPQECEDYFFYLLEKYLGV